MLLIKGNHDNLYLYSFPTRRSSDLSLIVSVTAQSKKSKVLAVLRMTFLDAGIYFPRENKNRSAGSTRAAVFVDRKSTRLNSSHVAISYAVFCLKKKS